MDKLLSRTTGTRNLCPWVRACVHRRLSTSFRQILLHPALKILAIRKYACKFLPCLQKNLLENPHIFPMNTSSEFLSGLYQHVLKKSSVCSENQNFSNAGQQKAGSCGKPQLPAGDTFLRFALRARVHRRLSTSFRQILLHTA